MILVFHGFVLYVLVFAKVIFFLKKVNFSLGGSFFSLVLYIKDRFMDKTRYNNIEDLIIPYCEGSLSAEDTKRIDEWISLSSENYTKVKEMHALLFSIETVQMVLSVTKSVEKPSSSTPL